MQCNVSLGEAQEILLSRISPLVAEEVCLLEAIGRVLAQDVYARDNIPPFARSPLDGFALRAEDTFQASRLKPANLKVIAEVPAGFVLPAPLAPGTAVKIMTGAPIPDGANAVVKKEDTDEGGEYVRIYQPIAPDSNIARAGEDVRAGERVLTRGMVLHSGAVGMLAALGVSRVPVSRKPRVAVLCTGEELMDVEKSLLPGKIYNSNLYSLSASIIAAGGEPVLLGTVPDRLEKIAAGLRSGLEEADLVISTGGASVGDYDLMYAAFCSMEAEVLFRRIAIKPGTPALAAQKNGKLLVGLSGNPAAASITFELLVRPLILKLQGREKWQRPQVTGIMVDDFSKGGGPRRFLRAAASYEEGLYKVRLAGKQTPGVLKSIVYCNALVDVPADSPPLKAGQEVQVILLTDEVN
ncbi:molybdopterin molybdotransferase MoeA [Zhaonella formicivorans]|uniref:molybdopterin molybdotransferase MoeA n=1 Tax=Zhaonella formicivorans TaxID=2528593 RepID=UPI001D127293|nr:gephyrin-like molybdotransferase Glp [Zhaonella formicivorans]